MNQELKERIENSGLRKDFIAEKLGIKANHFYQCCSGNRRLSKKRVQMLINLLESVNLTAAIL